jgi:hypothetical protein
MTLALKLTIYQGVKAILSKHSFAQVYELYQDMLEKGLVLKPVYRLSKLDTIGYTLKHYGAEYWRCNSWSKSKQP